MAESGTERGTGKSFVLRAVEINAVLHDVVFFSDSDEPSSSELRDSSSSRGTSVCIPLVCLVEFVKMEEGGRSSEPEEEVDCAEAG